MEYPSKNDIFLKFKAIYDGNNKFIDFVLIDTSENFHNVINYKSNVFLGKKISEIVLENEEDILGLKYLYYHMIPKTRRKFEIYLETLEIWYLVNIFSEDKDTLMLFYTDISRYKNNGEKAETKSFNDFEKTAK